MILIISSLFTNGYICFKTLLSQNLLFNTVSGHDFLVFIFLGLEKIICKAFKKLEIIL